MILLDAATTWPGAFEAVAGMIATVAIIWIVLR